MQPPDPDDIDKILLDGSDDDVTIEWSVANEDGTVSTREVTLTLDETSPKYLREAARKFTEAIRRGLKEDAHKPDTNPCETCIGTCCAIHFDTVHVNQQDVFAVKQGLAARGLNPKEVDAQVDEMFDMYPGTLWTGAVGELERVDYKDGERQACINLKDDGCSIYEFRPRICREYTSWDCDIHEEDPEKVDGKIHLRVLSEGVEERADE